MKNIKSYQDYKENIIQEGFRDAGYGFKKYQPPSTMQTLKRKTKSLFGIENAEDRRKLESIYSEIENPPYSNYLQSVRDLSNRFPSLVCQLGPRSLSIDCDPKDPSIRWGNKQLDLADLEHECERLYYFIKKFSTENPASVMEARTTPKSSYSVIPVYNEVKFTRDVKSSPEQNIKYSEVISTLEKLLQLQDAGEIKKITVVAEVPTQGKGTPQYIQDIIQKERERVAMAYKLRTGKEINPNSPDFDFDIDRFGNQRTIFFDSEFIVKRIEKIGTKEYVIGTPASLEKKGFEAPIAPIKVEEIFYTPSNS
jgi:hypothetical protein